MASLDEIEQRRSNNSKKKTKRSKTTELESSNPRSKQRLSSSGDDVHPGGGRHIPEDVESKASKETQEINDTDTPLNGESIPQKSSVRRGRTLGNDNVSSKSRQKPSRRCASTVTKDMDDAWDRDQIDFKAGDAQKDAVNVQITMGLTRSQEQEYETLNGEISQNSHFHTSQEKDSDETNLIPDQTYDGRGKPPNSISCEDPANAVEEYQVDGNNHNLMGQRSTPRQENTPQMVVAISPHDTEELSSFNSVHVRKSSPSPIGDLSQPTPEDPFDESPPRQTVQRKPGRKRRAKIVDDSDESPDELNPSVDPPKQKRKLQSSRTGSKHGDADVQDDDDDIIIVPPEKRDSRNASHSEEPIAGGATEHVEEQQPADFEGTNSDGMDMPPKEQYKPRPSRSRGKPVEPEPETPKVPQKGSRKKKVKRGKTTSAMLKKSVESDVEDDVVWVDERPADVVFHDPVLPGKRKAKRSKTNDSYVEPKAMGNEGEGTVADNESNAAEQPEEKPVSNKVEEPIEATKPAPKKRGRKPKKTTEPLVTAETQAEDHKPEQKNEEVSDPETKALPNDSERAVDSPAEQQDGPLLDPPKGTHDNKDCNTPEPENRKSSPPQTAPTETPPPVGTPKKQTATAKTPSANEETMTPPPNSSQKGPSKHSPISTSGAVPYRVGLSRRANIAPLLKVVRK